MIRRESSAYLAHQGREATGAVDGDAPFSLSVLFGPPIPLLLDNVILRASIQRQQTITAYVRG